ncbi:MAG: 50S ribosomal protein L3 [Candidatus Aenigmarchaeota archaeon]|nr:50S ribosomal protein L3 [Candidatus Aenigmarchaeota archaeon]
MPHKGRPRRGSLQYKRVRAARIYPRISFYSEIDETKPLMFAGWKAGMTHVKYTDSNSKSPTYGKVITKAATIIEIPSLLVCGVRFYAGARTISEKWMDNLPKSVQDKAGKQLGSFVEKADDVRIIVATQPEKSGMKKSMPEVFEIGIGGKVQDKVEYAKSLLGKEISAKDIFVSGESISVTAVTKGYGYTGPVKRYGIRIQFRKDKQMHRHVGSLGPTTPGKVDWRVPQAGQYGFFNRTDKNKRVLFIGNDAAKINAKGGMLGYGMVKGDYMLIEGSVPGTKKRLVMLRKTKGKANPVELSFVSLHSKQGV